MHNTIGGRWEKKSPCQRYGTPPFSHCYVLYYMEWRVFWNFQSLTYRKCEFKNTLLKSIYKFILFQKSLSEFAIVDIIHNCYTYFTNVIVIPFKETFHVKNNTKTICIECLLVMKFEYHYFQTAIFTLFNHRTLWLKGQEDYSKRVVFKFSWPENTLLWYLCLCSCAENSYQLISIPHNTNMQTCALLLSE